MDFSQPADAAAIEAVKTAVAARGITVEVVATRQEALERLTKLIPDGSSVSTGASVTLQEIGFEDLLKSGTHRWRNLKAEYLSEADPGKQAKLRKESILADWFVGSVHAVTQTGQLVWASATGSQLAPYAYSAGNVVWVAGVQKITADVEQGLRRINDYIIPHEDVRMRTMTGGKMGTTLGKILILEREVAFLGRKLTLILVKEPTGD